jgi:hypothetical protein
MADLKNQKPYLFLLYDLTIKSVVPEWLRSREERIKRLD